MVLKPMKFTPEVLIGAPRRSAGLPNARGDRFIYTSSQYSFKDRNKYTQLHIQDVRTGGEVWLAQNENVSDPVWLDDAGDEFLCLRSEKNGKTSLIVCLGDSRYLPPPKDSWQHRHYVAGTIDAAAGNLKVAKLDPEGREFALIVSAPTGKDGKLVNSVTAKKTQSTGRLYSELYARHWDTWESTEKNSLWYGKLTKDKYGKISKHKNGKYRLSSLTNALHKTGLECPVRPFGGTDNFDISHNRIIFVAKDPDMNPALNTKSNVYILHIDAWDDAKSSKSLPQRVIVPGFEGASTSPVISPDGHKAAFLSMKTNGYEADKNQIFVLPDLDLANLAPKRAFSAYGSYEGSWDRSPSSVCFTPDSETLLTIAEEDGTARLFMLNADLTDVDRPARLTSTGYISTCVPIPTGSIFISGSSLIDNSFYAMINPRIPPGRMGDEGDLVTWSNSSSRQGSQFGLSPKQISSIWTPASDPKINKEVHSIVVLPSDFDEDKTYPVAYLIHGGPQGSWADSWSTRWNPAVFAEQGYIVVAPNPTGSTGYGQAFTDAIRCNWGGDPYEDIVNVFDWVSEKLPQANNDRAVALGASYGGYMINWIQGHPLGRKFRALVCHDGILSVAGMLATEELYFPLHDLGGVPWYSPSTPNLISSSNEPAQAYSNFSQSTLDAWRRWDPSQHFSHWSTPELVIHSSKDYRICIADGLAAFNVLQARGVESQFLTFEDENHWVLKPQNGLAWHKVVLNWINKHVGLPPYTAEDPDSDAFWGGVRGDAEEVVEMEGQGKPET